MAYQPEGLPVLLLDKIVGLISDPHTRRIGQHFVGKKFMCQFPGGQIYFESKLDLDTDGSRFAIPDAHGHKEDPTGQASTSAVDANGNFLDAETINYFVLPGGGFAGHHGIRIGDIGVVISGIRMAYGCFGDVGPANHLGEASIALHRELGHETVVGGHLVNAGLGGNAITIVFPNSGNGLGRTNKESETLGKAQFSRLQHEALHFEQMRIAEAQAPSIRHADEQFFQRHHHFPRR
jgi:hypothetical protein